MGIPGPSSSPGGSTCKGRERRRSGAPLFRQPGTLSSMHGERDLRRLLASLEPLQRPGTFVFAVVDDEALLETIVPEATVREDEGLAVVLRRERADALGISYDHVAAWITLRVHSALDAVGLTAAVSAALADAGLSCNVIAGHYHDHLLVPADRAPEAITVLTELSLAAR